MTEINKDNYWMVNCPKRRNSRMHNFKTKKTTWDATDFTIIDEAKCIYCGLVIRRLYSLTEVVEVKEEVK